MVDLPTYSDDDFSFSVIREWEDDEGQWRIVHRFVGSEEDPEYEEGPWAEFSDGLGRPQSPTDARGRRAARKRNLFRINILVR